MLKLQQIAASPLQYITILKTINIKMLQIPCLATKRTEESSFSSTEMEPIEERQHFGVSIVDSPQKQKYQEDQIIMEIENCSVEQNKLQLAPKATQYLPIPQKLQNFVGNYERFKIVEKKFIVESDEDSNQCIQQKKSSLRGKQNNLSIFYTQILESRVFHRDVIEAAKTEAALKDSVPADNQTISYAYQSKENYQKQVTSNESSLLYAANVLFLMGGSWTPQKICVKNEELRFSDFAMELKGLSKIKIFRGDADEKLLKIKMTINDQYFVIGVKAEDQQANKAEFQLFSSIIKAKLASKGLKTSQGGSKSKLMKKSQYLAKWQERHVVVEDDALFSSRQAKGKCTFKIKRGSIKQMWTRFDFINNLLIIKLIHSLKKTEFGIPIIDTNTMSSDNWLFTFYRLLKAG